MAFFQIYFFLIAISLT